MTATADHAATLLDRLNQNGGSDWYEALVAAAFDETGDLGQAIEAADAAYEEEPEGLQEACVPNKLGHGHHDDRTGHPCGTGAKEPAPSKEPTAKPIAKVRAGKAEPEAHPGSVHGSAVSVKPVKQRAFNGEPVATKTTLTKQETGRVGEAVVLAYLKSEGFADARPMNAGQTNFPIDLIEDHAPTEVKAGLCSNGKDAQKWRLTFSQESKKEKELYAKMTDEEKAAWNAKKQARIKERKEQALAEIEKATGKKAKPRTITVIVNPDTKTADVYVFDGWHDIIRWNSPEAKAAYKGSVNYEHASTAVDKAAGKDDNTSGGKTKPGASAMPTHAEAAKTAKNLLAQHGINARAGSHSSTFAKTQPAKVLVKEADIDRAEKLIKEAGLRIDVLADPDEGLELAGRK